MDEEKDNQMAPPESEKELKSDLEQELENEMASDYEPEQEIKQEENIEKNDLVETESTSEPKEENESNLESEEKEEPTQDSEEKTELVLNENEPEEQSAHPNSTINPPISTEPEKKKRGPIIIICLILLLVISGLIIFIAFPDVIQNLFGTTEVPQNSQSETAPEEDPAEIAAIASTNHLSEFDLSIMKLKNKNENVIYSPLSIKYALAMLKDGANGESKAQIEKLLGDYKPKAYINSENRSLANAMMIRNDFSEAILPSYTDTLKTKYNAEVIYDSFSSPDNANKWVSDKTLGIIENMFSPETVNPELDYMLINALAIDMKWENQLQCAENDHIEVPCKYYDIKFAHENYKDYINSIYDEEKFDKISFNNKEENTAAAKIGATANRYDIVSELGEDYITKTVNDEYAKWLDDVENNPEAHPCEVETDFNINEYLEELNGNFKTIKTSTDFSFVNTDTEKVFVKDLQKYDGSTLEYVGIMPKTESLSNYIKTLTAEKITNLIKKSKDSADLETYKNGVVTKLSGHIPFFKYNYTIDMIDTLESLGVTNIFNTKTADLSGMIKNVDLTSETRPYINVGIHKADIDFTNDGIKAAAVTAFGGKGAGCIEEFDYLWEVPVEEIDMTFDQPFFFLIHDKATEEAWFIGSVYEI